MAFIFPLWKSVFHLHCTLPDGGVKGICIDGIDGKASQALSHSHDYSGSHPNVY